MRLGSDRVISINVRVISATNKDLKKLIKDNKFREDLFFRLNVLKLHLPPLRERKQDISEYAMKYLKEVNKENRSSIKLDSAAIRALEGYEWPGNMRELQNTMERLLAYCQSGIIKKQDVIACIEDWYDDSLKESIHIQEKQNILHALIEANGVRFDAAKILEMDRSTLWRKMKQYKIKI